MCLTRLNRRGNLHFGTGPVDGGRAGKGGGAQLAGPGGVIAVGGEYHGGRAGVAADRRAEEENWEEGLPQRQGGDCGSRHCGTQGDVAEDGYSAAAASPSSCVVRAEIKVIPSTPDIAASSEESLK